MVIIMEGNHNWTPFFFFFSFFFSFAIWISIIARFMQTHIARNLKKRTLFFGGASCGNVIPMEATWIFMKIRTKYVYNLSFPMRFLEMKFKLRELNSPLFQVSKIFFPLRLLEYELFLYSKGNSKIFYCELEHLETIFYFSISLFW